MKKNSRKGAMEFEKIAKYVIILLVLVVVIIAFQGWWRPLFAAITGKGEEVAGQLEIIKINLEDEKQVKELEKTKKGQELVLEAFEKKASKEIEEGNFEKAKEIYEEELKKNYLSKDKRLDATLKVKAMAQFLNKGYQRATNCMKYTENEDWLGCITFNARMVIPQKVSDYKCYWVGGWRDKDGCKPCSQIEKYRKEGGRCKKVYERGAGRIWPTVCKLDPCVLGCEYWNGHCREKP